VVKNDVSKGVAFGLLLGVGIGLVLHNLALWAGIGLALGAAFGTVWNSRKESSTDPIPPKG
jgi:hypothetical protein